jgi:hypothetical protein
MVHALATDYDPGAYKDRRAAVLAELAAKGTPVATGGVAAIGDIGAQIEAFMAKHKAQQATTAPAEAPTAKPARTRKVAAAKPDGEATPAKPRRTARKPPDTRAS